MKRPALRLFVGFAFGIWLSSVTHFDPSFTQEVLSAGVLFLILSVAWWRPKNLGWLAGLGSIFLGVLWLSRAEQNFHSQSVQCFAGRKGTVGLSGIIVTPPEMQGGRLKWTLRAERLACGDSVYPVSGRVLISSRIPNLPLDVGDWVGLTGHLRLPSSPRNFGEFDYRAYLKHRGISTLFYVSERKPIRFEKGKSRWNVERRFISPLRKRFLLTIQNILGFGPEAHLLKGLLMGQRGEIEPSVRAAFARTGVIHVLAVSGLHVGFVLGLLLFVLKFLRPPAWLKLLVVLIALIFYTQLTGNKPPVVRASLMAFLLLLGFQIERRADVVNILAFAALILLLVNPFFLFDPSFQLSFLAVLGIVLFYTRLWTLFSFTPHNRFQLFFKKTILPLLLVSFSAQLGTLPLIVTIYHRLPVYALAANLIVIPLVFVIVTGGFLLLFLPVLNPPWAVWLAVPLKFLLKFLIQFVLFFSRLPGGNLPVSGEISLWKLLAYGLLIGMVWFAANPKRVRQLGLVAAVVTVAWFGWNNWRLAHPVLQVDFLNAGQSACSVVRLPDGKCLVVESGQTARRFDEARRVLVPFLNYLGVGRVDVVLQTGAVSGFGGWVHTLPGILPGKILWTGAFGKGARTPFAPQKTARFPVVVPVHAGTHFLSWHGVNVWIFSPDSLEPNAPVVLSLHFGEHRFLFAEGSFPSTQKRLLQFGRLLRSTVLAVSGPRLSHEFVRRVSPDFLVCRKQLFPVDSVGALSGRIFSLPQTGGVEFQTDGSQLRFRTVRKRDALHEKS